MTVPREQLGLAAALCLAASCLAPPPPIALETAYGEVRAEDHATAAEFAELYEELVPRVREILPGTREREIDLWVQKELRVYRHRPRHASVRGFTLVDGTSGPRRIHLQEDGQSSWYLSHELVHALVSEEWAPLPGLLEEGLADHVAEMLNPREAGHIRAQRLLNASVFTGGLAVGIVYSYPESQASPRGWKRCHRDSRIQPGEALDPALVQELLETPREELRRRDDDLPEAFYGISWLIVSRIVERRGLEGLHRLCLDATEAGERLVAADTLLAAAEIDLDRLDPQFLASCCRRSDIYAVARLEPDLFAEQVVEVLAPWEASFGARSALRYLRPALLGEDGRELYLRYMRSLRRSFERQWRSSPPAAPPAASPAPPLAMRRIGP